MPPTRGWRRWGAWGKYRSWQQLDVAEAGLPAQAHDEERARLEAGTSRLAEITRTLEHNSEQASAVERLNRELGGYGQSLAQYLGEVLRRWPELRADMDARSRA